MASHKNRFITSAAYKSGLRSPILAKKAKKLLNFYIKFELNFQNPYIQISNP